MKKIICIGECSLDILFRGEQPSGAMAGGRLVRAAAMMANEGLPVAMASEASADPVGDMVVKILTDAGVDCTSVDRFTEGRTPLSVITSGQGPVATATRYEQNGDGGFDIVWPRVDEGSVVLYGGYYAVDARVRERLVPFLNHCAERKAVMVYAPGFRNVGRRRLTHLMPAILENLELAHAVVATDTDLSLIFGLDDSDRCYSDHIDFYCRSLIACDTRRHRLCYYSGKQLTTDDVSPEVAETMTWNCGLAAGVASAIFTAGLTANDLDAPAEETRLEVLRAAAAGMENSAQALGRPWRETLL